MFQFANQAERTSTDAKIITSSGLVWFSLVGGEDVLSLHTALQTYMGARGCQQARGTHTALAGRDGAPAADSVFVNFPLLVF